MSSCHEGALVKSLENMVVDWLLGQSSPWPRNSEGKVKLEA